MHVSVVVRSVLMLAVPQDTADRTVGWRSDLQRLFSEARAQHAGPARPAWQPQFEAAVMQLASRVPELSDERLATEVQRLLAMLHDGHSLLYVMSTPRVQLTTLPIDLYWFDDGLYITGGINQEADRLMGSRVARIDGRTPEDLLERLEPYISGDNERAARAFSPIYLTVPAFLETIGVRFPNGRVAFTLTDSAGRERTVLLSPGPMRRHHHKLGAPKRSPAPPPLYLEQMQRPYWMRRLPQYHALYFQFNQVMNGEGESLAGFAARLADTLSLPAIRYVIVDVRHNNGGNNGLLAPLLETLAGFGRTRGGQRIYVITSRSTFSAAQNFINRLDRAVHPMFAGEPTMSSPNFTGEDNEVVLPYSGLQVSISNRYWQDSDPDDRRHWLPVQLPVPLTAAAWLRNQDPVLDAVLRAIAADTSAGN